MAFETDRRQVLLVLAIALLCGSSSGVVDSQFSKASGDFASSLYSTTTAENNGSLIFSPASIHLALSLLSFGAAGATKDEILKGLKYPSGYTSFQIANNYEAITGSIKSSNYLKLANKLFLTQGYTIKPSFNDIAAKSFDSSAQNLNFFNAAQSADIINKWVEGKTNSKIKDLFTQDAFTNDTRLVLVNAIYFKGLWKDAFHPNNTRKRPFFLGEKGSVSVELMMTRRNVSFAYMDDLSATAMALPYKNSDMFMLLILPYEFAGLQLLEKSLQTVDLKAIVSRLKMTANVSVYIPKFKVETTLDMTNILQSMNMNSMFSNNADFSELLTTKEGISVTEVIHKAFIEVNEEGIGAATETGEEASTYSAGDYFLANHPFFYAITNDDGVFFSGRVVKF